MVSSKEVHQLDSYPPKLGFSLPKNQGVKRIFKNDNIVSNWFIDSIRLAG